MKLKWLVFPLIMLVLLCSCAKDDTSDSSSRRRKSNSLLFADQNPETFEVADYVGMTFSDIQDAEDFNKYNIQFKYEYSDEYETGVVYKQEPVAGKKIKKGDTVTLYVSRGEKIVKVPDVIGMTEARAISILEKSNGFVVRVVKRYSYSVEKGCVISTDPPIDSDLECGSDITLYVSRGAGSAGYEEELTSSEFERLESDAMSSDNVSIDSSSESSSSVSQSSTSSTLSSSNTSSNTAFY